MVVAILCLLFWLSFSLDAVHFQVRKLELPGWLRTGFSLTGICLLAAAAGLWVLSRVLRSFVSPGIGAVLDRLEPFGFFILFGLLYAGILNPLLSPLLNAVAHLVMRLSGVDFS